MGRSSWVKYPKLGNKKRLKKKLNIYFDFLLLLSSTMSLSITSSVFLKSGQRIPQIGFGTYESTSEEAYTSVKQALEAGYRHIVS